MWRQKNSDLLKIRQTNMLLPQNTSEKDFLVIKLALYRSMLTILKESVWVNGLCTAAYHADNPYKLELEQLSELWERRPTPEKSDPHYKKPTSYWWPISDKPVRVRALRKAILEVRFKLFVLWFFRI